ncbi:MAG: hypothetical protein QXD11_00145 [Candidatus Micrarchaeaceae archaeon]
MICTYATDWVGLNYLVILIGLSIVAFVYAIANFLPSKEASKWKAISRAEIIQLFVSILIIGILMAFSSSICGIVSTASQALTGTSMDPFQYAEYFINNMSQNLGLKLLSNIYTTSMTYSITSKVFSLLPKLISSSNIPLFSIPAIKASGISPLSVSISSSASLGYPYSVLSTLYIGAFSPLLITTIGTLFIMYLLLPIIQAAAFVIVLPAALIMRSIAYTSGSKGLRSAANAVLAIAIAFYFVYPLTIALDNYMVNQIFSASNPEYQYLHETIILENIAPSIFTSSVQSSSTIQYNGEGTNIQLPSILTMWQYLGTFGILQGYSFIFTVPADANYLVTAMAQFFFISIVLFAIDLMITIAFAISLSKALDSSFSTNW